MAAARSGEHPGTIGADKGYDTKGSWLHGPAGRHTPCGPLSRPKPVSASPPSFLYSHLLGKGGRRHQWGKGTGHGASQPTQHQEALPSACLTGGYLWDNYGKITTSASALSRFPARSLAGAFTVAVSLCLASCGGTRSAPQDQVKGVVNDVLQDKTARDKVEGTVRNSLDILYSLSKIGKKLVDQELADLEEQQ